MSDTKIFTDEYMANVSKILAEIIMDVKVQTSFIPIEDMRHIANEMRNRASMYNSMAALNPGYSPEESNHRMAGVEAFDAFVKFIEKAKSVEKAAAQAKEAQQLRDQLSELFK